MKALKAVIIVAGSLAACTSEPFSGELSGSWGGAQMFVSATPASVTMTLGCGATVRIPHGLVVDASGAFRITDSLRGSLDGLAHDTLPGRPVIAVAISGTLTGDRLVVRLESPLLTGQIAPGWWTAIFDGRRGQPDDNHLCTRA